MSGVPGTRGGERFISVGATRHVGSRVIRRLAQQGCDVTALVRRPNTRLIEEMLAPEPEGSR